MDSRIQLSVVANLSRRPAALETGPFVLGLDPSTDSPHINYATPRPGAAITKANVADLVAAFRDAGRKPRLEYVTSCAPGLEDLLIEAGFQVEDRHDYLVCSTGSFEPAPVPDGFRLSEPATDPQRLALVSVQNEAFGGEPTATAADADRVARQQAAGGIAIMAVNSDSGGIDRAGACAGGGQAVPPNDGVSEIGGIAVRPAYRRRGLAAAITAAVTGRLFAAGTDVAWLEASGQESWRVYERVGFRPTGKRLYISLD